MAETSHTPDPIKRTLRRMLAPAIWRSRRVTPRRLQRLADPRAERDMVRFADTVCRYLPASKAQICQDLWVVFESGEKRDGFYVEFGAANGRDLSNTWLLDHRFGWKGILAEPNPNWHQDLAEHRPAAIIDHRAVYPVSGEKLPLAVEGLWEYSSLAQYADRDKHAGMREGAATVEVETITLNDLLDAHDAPSSIDFVSIDTEGGEIEILRSFDFARHDVALFAIEHNHTEDREAIHELLTGKGYERRFEEFSAFDDWYAKAG